MMPRAGIDRSIRRSLMLQVRNLFQAPPSGSGLAAYTLYDEADLRQVSSGALTPTRPCVFIVDSYIRPVAAALPMVVFETLPRKVPFELGNRDGRRTGCLIHVMGRMTGEVDDLCSFIADQVPPQISLYDFSSGSPVLFGYGVVADGDEGIEIEPLPLSRDDLREEMSLDHWKVVKFTLTTTQ